MSAANPKLIWDGFTSQRDGMNDGVSQRRLGPAQASVLINATTRGDFVRQRPGWPKIMQVLDESPGFFQHASSFETDSGRTFLMAVIGGRFFRVDPLAKTVLEVTIPGDPNPSNLPIGWSVQAETWWLYNDGQSKLFIFNGSSARRAGKNEFFPGSVLAYVQGRVWYASPDGLSFYAGDLVGSKDSGTPGYNWRDSVLKQTENTYLNEGGSFRVPPNSGGIRAMQATAILDTSQGQGPLQVLCENNGFSVNTPVDRAIWKDVTYPIQTVALINAGTSGAQSTVNVNGDLFFRSADGIRSFIIARRQFRDWGNTPQSFEVSNLLKYDQENLLIYGSGAVLDNRLLITASPAYTSLGVYHRGLIALDLSPINSIKTDGTPAYDGLWNGVNILSVVPTKIGVFMFTLAPDGSIELWQISKNELFDNSTGRVSWTMIPRQLFLEQDLAGRPGKTLKKLQLADLEYDQIIGSVDYQLQYAPDSYPCYTDWYSWSDCVISCGGVPGCKPALNLQAGYAPERKIPEPPDVCATGAVRPLRNFFSLNLRIDVTGPTRLLGVRVGATIETEPKYDPQCYNTLCVPISCCRGTGENMNFFTYSAPGQGPGPTPSSSGFPVPPTLPGIPQSPIPNPKGPGNPDTDPGTDTPDLPEYNPTPQDPPPEPLGCEVFLGDWTDPGPPDVFGNTHGMGTVENPVTGAGLGPGVLEAWSNSLWQQFQNWVALNEINVTQCQIVVSYTGDSLPPSGERRYDPTQVFVDGVYASSFGRGYILAIEWCGE